MERLAQFRDGERVDSSTGTAERLDAVKRDRSRCQRAGAMGGDDRCASTGGFLNGRARRLGPFSTPARVDCRLSYTTGQATIARSAIVAC